MPRTTPRRAGAPLTAVLLALAGVASGCAVGGPAAAPGAGAPAVRAVGTPGTAGTAGTVRTVRTVRDTLPLGGARYAVEWTVPPASPALLLTLQHGFTRDCARLRASAAALAAAGALTLCVEAPMVAGNPALAEALAAALAAGAVAAPGGQALPARIAVAGHSAGAHFASRLGWALAAQAPQRLAGALLFDPVGAGSSFATNLQALSAGGARPVLALLAEPGGCNARGSARPVLAALRAQAVAAGRDGAAAVTAVQPGPRATHVDVEGEDTDWLAVVACGGRPDPADVRALRALAAAWTADLALGQAPGGRTARVLQPLLDGGRAQLLP